MEKVTFIDFDGDGFSRMIGVANNLLDNITIVDKMCAFSSHSSYH